jgi:hypothetical protein
VKIFIEEFNQESRTKGEEQKEVELLNQGMIEFFQDSRNRNVCASANTRTRSIVKQSLT